MNDYFSVRRFIFDTNILDVMDCLYLNGLTNEQTAERLNISVQTVYNRHLRGLDMINEIFNSERSNLNA
ncbi:MAG: sigma factor-like helix-turn-helix DNA-binding protein [Ruminococcus sp.]|nr:sigma factor-like helix-turn-helix DNA-binding protein [Ruminococcus sp.]